MAIEHYTTKVDNIPADQGGNVDRKAIDYIDVQNFGIPTSQPLHLVVAKETFYDTYIDGNEDANTLYIIIED